MIDWKIPANKNVNYFDETWLQKTINTTYFDLEENHNEKIVHNL